MRSGEPGRAENFAKSAVGFAAFAFHNLGMGVGSLHWRKRRQNLGKFLKILGIRNDIGNLPERILSLFKKWW